MALRIKMRIFITVMSGGPLVRHVISVDSICSGLKVKMIFFGHCDICDRCKDMESSQFHRSNKDYRKSE